MDRRVAPARACKRLLYDIARKDQKPDMDAILDILGLLVLSIFLMVGGVLAVFQMPGTWFVLLSAAAYSWVYGFERIGWTVLAVMGGLALVAEFVEIFAGMKGAQKFGASRAASWGALIGGFVGMIVFTPLIPVPVVGTVVGGLLGCFAGAFLMERRAGGDSAKGAKVGFGAAVGRLVGLMVKLATVLTMAALAAGSALHAALTAGA